MFSDDDLAAIAALCQEHDVVAISDEVYEHLLFDGRTHRSIATLPGMRERTLRISSAAKTFNCTGWKVGWVSGPAPLVTAARAAKQFMSYVGSGPFQPAVAHALNTEMDWVAQSAAALQRKRDILSTALVTRDSPSTAARRPISCAPIRARSASTMPPASAVNYPPGSGGCRPGHRLRRRRAALASPGAVRLRQHDDSLREAARRLSALR